MEAVYPASPYKQPSSTHELAMSQPLRKRALNSEVSSFKAPDKSDEYFKPRKLSYYDHIRRHVFWKHILIVSTLWVVVMMYYQKVKPGTEINKCQWKNWEKFEADQLGHSVVPHRVLLIADPQIVDDHTYPKRPRWIQWITTRISDNYMAINYKLLQEKLKPDSTIFLGDLFDGGREWFDDKKWYAEWRRFNAIFPSHPNRRFYYNTLGNHDAGWDKTMNVTLIDRFKTIFGDSNDFVHIGNHTFVFLDTISMSASNNNDSSIHEQALSYFDKLVHKYLPEQDKLQISKDQNKRPRILLTHVPLFRDPAKQPCKGPRENGKPFPLVNGGTFQTVLWPETTNDLLLKLQPSVVFSGDDHDYCEINHEFVVPENGGHHAKTTTEYTTKSFSMNMGVSYPAAQLLSLYNPLDKLDSSKNQNHVSYQTQICYSYAPFVTLYVYGFLLLITIIYWNLLIFFPAKFFKLQLLLATRLGKVASRLLMFNIEKSKLDTNKIHLDDYVHFNIKKLDLLNQKSVKFGYNFGTQLAVIFVIFVNFYIFI